LNKLNIRRPLGGTPILFNSKTMSLVMILRVVVSKHTQSKYLLSIIPELKIMIMHDRSWAIL
jgi:hypothetical protein